MDIFNLHVYTHFTFVAGYADGIQMQAHSPMDGSTLQDEEDDGSVDHSNDDKPGDESG